MTFFDVARFIVDESRDLSDLDTIAPEYIDPIPDESDLAPYAALALEQ